jgi:hypothetical protein
LSRTRNLTLAAALLAGLAGLAAPSAASAQSNSAIAEQLFIDGQKLMAAGKYPEACAKFADSQRLDPATGTLMHLADCNEKAGKIATAWSEFTDVAAMAQKAGQGDREKYAREHAAGLAGKLQKFVIDLPKPPDGVAIKLDSVTLPTGVIGTEIPLDPGDHALEVSAPGKKTFSQKVNLGSATTVTHVAVALEDDTSAPAAAAGGAAAPAAAGTPGADQGTDSGGSTKRIIGYVLGGAGIVSIGVAVGEEVTSIGRKNDVSKYPDGTSARQTVSDQGSQAQTYAIIFGAAGLVAVGAGVYLILTSHDAPAAPATTGKPYVTPMLGPGLAGAGVNLAF